MSKCGDDGHKCNCNSRAVKKVRTQFPELSEDELTKLTNELISLGQKAFVIFDAPFVGEEHISSIKTAAIQMGVVGADEATAYEDEWALHVTDCSFCIVIRSHSFV